MADERTMAWALALGRELWHGADPEAECLLRGKCQWEHMTRSAVLRCWGDPREWVPYTGAAVYQEVYEALLPLYDPKDALAWMAAQHVDLGGLSPWGALQRGRGDDVLAIIDRLVSGAYV